MGFGLGRVRGFCEFFRSSCLFEVGLGDLVFTVGLRMLAIIEGLDLF